MTGELDTPGGLGEGMALVRYGFRVNNLPYPCPATSYNIFSPKTTDFS